MPDGDARGEANRPRRGDRPRTANRRAVLRGATATVVWGSTTVAGRRADGPGGSSAGGFPSKGVTEYGRAVDLGDGSVGTFTVETPSEEPRYHGVEFDRAALEGLPSAGELDGAAEDAYPDKYGPTGAALEIHREPSLEFFVPFPEAAKTPFTFLGLNWNPGGHPGGKGAWRVPHFDVHFHTLEMDTVDAIRGPSRPPYEGEIPSDRIPRGYVRSPLVDERYVTDMGEHTAPADAPELPDGPDDVGDPDAFENTLIQGFVGVGEEGPDPRLAFVEPMITREFLRGFDGNETYEVPQPDVYPHDERHPTEYGVRDVPSGDAIVVWLGGFEGVCPPIR